MRNHTRVSAVKTQVKTFLETAKSSEAEATEKELRLAQKKIDKLAATGVIHKNRASRQKSQLARKRNEVAAKA